MFSFIRLSSLWFSISGIAIAASIGSIAIFGLNFGIDFTGGSLLEVRFANEVTHEQVADTLASATELDLGNPVVTAAGEASEGRYLLRFRYLETEAEQAQLMNVLTTALGEFSTERLTTVGPTIGATLKQKALRALSYAGIAIVLYLATVFRDRRKDSSAKYIVIGMLVGSAAFAGEFMVSVELTRWLVFLGNLIFFFGFIAYEIGQRNPSLKYGVCALLALAHDVIVTLGIFAVLGAMFGVEIDSLFVTALLTIMGFSVHDTIVVFDRLRENLKHRAGSETFGQVADRSLRQTLARSINTSLTTLITLAALFFLGAISIKWFVLALMVGIVAGTYSSIFTATPLLVAYQRRLSESGDS